MPEPFDWEILHRPSAMGMVRGQLSFSWMVLSGRLAQLTDDQYFWRPSSEALTVVRRHYTGRFRSLGSGEWVAQWPDEPDHRLADRPSHRDVLRALGVDLRRESTGTGRHHPARQRAGRGGVADALGGG